MLRTVAIISAISTVVFSGAFAQAQVKVDDCNKGQKLDGPCVVRNDQALEAAVNKLIGDVGTLQGQVTSLNTAIQALKTAIANLPSSNVSVVEVIRRECAVGDTYQLAEPGWNIRDCLDTWKHPPGDVRATCRRELFLQTQNVRLPLGIHDESEATTFTAAPRKEHLPKNNYCGWVYIQT